MDYKLLSAITLVAISLTGCRSESADEKAFQADRVIECDFSPKESTSQIDAIFESAAVTPLEQSDDSMVSADCEIIEHNGDYILIDKQQRSCYRFGRDGGYKNRIGRSGKAGDEYLDIANVQIDGDDILIYSNAKATIYRYNSNGDILGSIETNIRAQQLQKVGDKYYGYFGYNNGQQKERLVIYDKDFEVLKMMLPSEAKLIVFSESIPSVTQQDKDIYIRETYNKSIYKISKDGVLSTPLEFDFKQYNIPDACFTQSDAFKAAEIMLSNDFASIYRFDEHEDNALVQINYQFATEPGSVYNMIGIERNDNYSWITATPTGANAILFSSVRRLADDGVVVALIDQDIIKEFSANNSGFIENIDVLQLSGNSNPAIVRFKIK